MSDIPEVIFKPRVMEALLINIMAHDVTHDYNGGSSSTKRLVKLKKRIAELFNLPQVEEEPQAPRATPAPRPRATQRKRPMVATAALERSRATAAQPQGKRRRVEVPVEAVRADVAQAAPVEAFPVLEVMADMVDVESRHSDDFVNSLGNWLSKVGRNLGRVTRAAAVSLDNLRQELEEATVYLLGEMAPRQGAAPHRQGGGWLQTVQPHTIHPQGSLFAQDNPALTKMKTNMVEKRGSNMVFGIDAEYLKQYNFIAGALASPIRISSDPEDPSMAEEARLIRQMMADIFHSLCESNPGMPPITLYTSLTYRTLIAFSLVTDDYKRSYEEQEIRKLFTRPEDAVRAQMLQQWQSRGPGAMAAAAGPAAAAGGAVGSGPADAAYVDYINDVSEKLNEYTIESTVAATRDMDKAAIEEYLNGIMNALLPTDNSMKPPTSAPNKVTAASYARMLSSKRASPGDARLKMVYDEFLGKFATNVAAQKANNDIKMDRYEAALERVELGQDLPPEARGVVNGLSRAVIDGVLRQLPRKTPELETKLERGFHDLQYGIMEGARDTGSTSTIDANLYDGFMNLLEGDPALLTREAALELAKTARENQASDPLYKSFDTVNNASDLRYLYENDDPALHGKDKDDYTACTGASVADAMSYCSFAKAKDDKNLVLHDMVFQLGANNAALNYTGYSTKAKKDVYSVGFHIYVNKDFVVGPTFKNVNLKTGKELSASSVYANVLNYIGTNMSQVASLEDIADEIKEPSILAEFLACICFKNTGDLFQEMNALLRYRGVTDPERRSLAEDPFMMFVGNDRPSSVRGMAMARMYEPGSAVNKNALMGYVSTGVQEFVHAFGTQGTQGGAKSVKSVKAKGKTTATRKSILKKSKNKTRARKKVRFTLRKSA